MQLTTCITENESTGRDADSAYMSCFVHGGWLCVGCKRTHVRDVLTICRECGEMYAEYTRGLID